MIGIGAVVAARSVVTKDVPPYAIVAGTPARKRSCALPRLPEAQIERLLALGKVVALRPRPAQGRIGLRRCQRPRWDIWKRARAMVNGFSRVRTC